jgi:hypothetical protein
MITLELTIGEAHLLHNLLRLDSLRTKLNNTLIKYYDDEVTDEVLDDYKV